MVMVETTRVIQSSEIAAFNEELLMRRGEVLWGEAIIPGSSYRLRIRWEEKAEPANAASAELASVSPMAI